MSGTADGENMAERSRSKVDDWYKEKGIGEESAVDGDAGRGQETDPREDKPMSPDGKEENTQSEVQGGRRLIRI